MDVFSLEEDDCSELFITQSDKSDMDVMGPVLGDPHNFSSPLVTLTPGEHDTKPQYSDISEDEFDLFPFTNGIQPKSS